MIVVEVRGEEEDGTREVNVEEDSFPPKLSSPISTSPITTTPIPLAIPLPLVPPYKPSIILSHAKLSKPRLSKRHRDPNKL